MGMLRSIKGVMNPFSILTLLSSPDNNPARKFKKWSLTFFLNACFRGFPQNMLFQVAISRIGWMKGVNWEEKYPLDCLGPKEYFLPGAVGRIL